MSKKLKELFAKARSIKSEIDMIKCDIRQAEIFGDDCSASRDRVVDLLVELDQVNISIDKHYN